MTSYLPVPGGNEGPSGLIICAENYITYRNFGDQPDIKCPIPRRRVSLPPLPSPPLPSPPLPSPPLPSPPLPSPPLPSPPLPSPPLPSPPLLTNPILQFRMT